MLLYRKIWCAKLNKIAKSSLMEKSFQSFHELSQITLKNRRALRPLLDKLCEKDLKYTWRFPFALILTHNGRQHTLRIPDDLADFWDSLQLGLINLPDCYQNFILPPGKKSPTFSFHFPRETSVQEDEVYLTWWINLQNSKPQSSFFQSTGWCLTTSSWLQLKTTYLCFLHHLHPSFRFQWCPYRLRPGLIDSS